VLLAVPSRVVRGWLLGSEGRDYDLFSTGRVCVALLEHLLVVDIELDFLIGLVDVVR